jgi:phosphohistidine phosphatase
MQYLIFVRHAKSSWNELHQADHDRPLNDRGFRDAPEMASRLKHAAFNPDVLISSSALRAWTTASFFAQAFEKTVEKKPRLYHAAPDVYLDFIHALTPEITTAVFFGHNPGITQLANLIKPGCIENVPTCGIILCSFDGSWHEAEWQRLSVMDIMSPKDAEYD